MMCSPQQVLVPARWMGAAKVGDSSKDVVGTASVDLPRQYVSGRRLGSRRQPSGDRCRSWVRPVVSAWSRRSWAAGEPSR